ncbi:MAG: hypothetical protein FWF53_05760 [Candidatus Azobacteroides sp.]|nr:hypothetical protein [Candidatus Azobacteroides sp.]
MKLIYKNQIIKIFSLGLMLAGIVSLGFLEQSCTQDDLDNDINDDMSIHAKYLDLDVTSTDLFTPEELNILGQASYRITTHMVFDSNSNKYVFDLKSPAEINISERLFDYIYPNMQNVPVTTTNWPRIKPDNYQESTVSDGGFGWSQIQVHMSDQQMVSYFQSAINNQGSASEALAAAGVGAGLVPGGLATGTGLSVASLGMSLLQSATQQDYNSYINQSNRTGGTATFTTVTSSTGTCTMTNTTVQYGYTKK